MEVDSLEYPVLGIYIYIPAPGRVNNSISQSRRVRKMACWSTGDIKKCWTGEEDSKATISTRLFKPFHVVARILRRKIAFCRAIHMMTLRKSSWAKLRRRSVDFYEGEEIMVVYQSTFNLV